MCVYFILVELDCHLRVNIIKRCFGARRGSSSITLFNGYYVIELIGFQHFLTKLMLFIPSVYVHVRSHNKSLT